MLNRYKLLIQLRRNNAALRDGDQTMLATSDDKDVLAYTRGGGAGKVLVLCNFSGSEQTVSVKSLVAASAGVLAANYSAGTSVTLSSVSLPGYGAVVAELK
jgi:glycosidase